MMGTASELRTKIGKLKKRRMEESKLTEVEKVDTNGDISHHHKGNIFKLHPASIKLGLSFVEGEYHLTSSLILVSVLQVYLMLSRMTFKNF